MKHENPYAGLVGSLTPAEFEDLSDAVEERGLREELGFGTLAEAAELYRPDPACPECGEGGARRDGVSASGLQRWRCRACVFGQVKVSEMVKGAFRFGKRKFSEMVRPTGRAPTPAPPTVRTSYR